MQETITKTKEKICDIVLGMENSFFPSEIVEKARTKGIEDKELIYDVIGELYELGKIRLMYFNRYKVVDLI